MDEIERIKQVYSTRYKPDPTDIRYPWHPLNPVAIYYRQAHERALAGLFRKMHLPLGTMNVLDVGCGTGSFLRYLVSVGAAPEQLQGIDLMDYRIEMARQACPPGVTLQVGNAGALPYTDQAFDLVSQFTVFSSILEPTLRQQVATEMRRVLKRGGLILWYDMSRAQGKQLHPLRLLEIRQLFPGMQTVHLQRLHNAWAGRIARRTPMLDELLDHLPGIPKSHILLLLQKP